MMFIYDELSVVCYQLSEGDDTVIVCSLFRSCFLFEGSFCADFGQSRFVTHIRWRVFYHSDDIVVVQVFRIEEIDVAAFAETLASDVAGAFTVCLTDTFLVLFFFLFQLEWL